MKPSLLLDLFPSPLPDPPPSIVRPSARQQAKHGHDDPPKNGEKEFTISRPCPNSTLEEYTTLGAWGNRRLFVVFLRKIVKTSPSVRLGQLVITWMCVWTQYGAARNRNEEALPPPPPPPFHPSSLPSCALQNGRSEAADGRTDRRPPPSIFAGGRRWREGKKQPPLLYAVLRCSTYLQCTRAGRIEARKEAKLIPPGYKKGVLSELRTGRGENVLALNRRLRRGKGGKWFSSLLSPPRGGKQTWGAKGKRRRRRGDPRLGRPRLFLTPPRAPRKRGGGGKTRPKQTFREGAKRRREGGKGRKGGDVKAFFFAESSYLAFASISRGRKWQKWTCQQCVQCCLLARSSSRPFVWFLSPLYRRLFLAPLHKQKEASIRVEEEEEEEEQDEGKREETRTSSPFTSWLQRRV